MNTTQSRAFPADLHVFATLAHVLERLDNSSVPVDADQYRSVVRRLAGEFDAMQTDAEVQALLDTYPAAAQLYENLNYQYAGLCRSPLAFSLAAEQLASDAIRRIMSR